MSLLQNCTTKKLKLKIRKTNKQKKNKTQTLHYLHLHEANCQVSFPSLAPGTKLTPAQEGDAEYFQGCS